MLVSHIQNALMTLCVFRLRPLRPLDGGCMLGLDGLDIPRLPFTRLLPPLRPLDGGVAGINHIAAHLLRAFDAASQVRRPLVGGVAFFLGGFQLLDQVWLDNVALPRQLVLQFVDASLDGGVAFLPGRAQCRAQFGGRLRLDIQRALQPVRPLPLGVHLLLQLQHGDSVLLAFGGEGLLEAFDLVGCVQQRTVLFPGAVCAILRNPSHVF
jgi:hypothetical protein